MLHRILCLSLCLAPVLAAPARPAPVSGPTYPSSVLQDYPPLAPFTAVRWNGDSPEVRVDGSFYSLLELEGYSAEKLVEFAKASYGRRWSKRFSEDMTQVLSELGSPPGSTVSMVLAELGSGKRIELPAVTMTTAKRRQALQYNHEPAPEVLRIRREHAERVSKEWAWLAEAPRDIDGWNSPLLSAQRVGEDLDQLEWLLEDRYAYLSMLGVDYRAALDAVRLAAEGGMARSAFALRLMKVLALFGDGHTRLEESLRRITPPGRTPFLLMDSADGLACVSADRSGPLDADYPYLAAIDGIDIERWIEASAVLSSAYSPAFRRRQAVEGLRYLGFAAMELGHELGASCELTLSDGKRSQQVQVPVAERRAIYGTWPRGESRILEGNLGYLRIERMDDEPGFLEALRQHMQSFAGTEGLIIDVRGNGGGSRDALKLIYPYLMAKGEAPQVVNIARYRLRSGEPAGQQDGYLQNRSLYPRTWQGWNAAELVAIDTFAKTFQPSWAPGPQRFSSWHYMVLSSSKEAPRYGAPVKILIDSGCFSATDIFVSAFRGRPKVELIGSPTGGGSGRSRGIQLANSGLSMRLSSMASYQPTGQTYDGHGVQPDLEIAQPAEFFWGGQDAVLEAAIRRLQD